MKTHWTQMSREEIDAHIDRMASEATSRIEQRMASRPQPRQVAAPVETLPNEADNAAAELVRRLGESDKWR